MLLLATSKLVSNPEVVARVPWKYKYLSACLEITCLKYLSSFIPSRYQTMCKIAPTITNNRLKWAALKSEPKMGWKLTYNRISNPKIGLQNLLALKNLPLNGSPLNADRRLQNMPHQWNSHKKRYWRRRRFQIQIEMNNPPPQIMPLQPHPEDKWRVEVCLQQFLNH